MGMLDLTEKGKSKKTQTASWEKAGQENQPSVVNTVQCEKCGVNSSYFFL